MMNLQPHARHDPARPYRALHFLTLLESHQVARRALQRLEELYERYPEPDLRAAIEQLRRDGTQEYPSTVPWVTVPLPQAE